MDTMLGHGHHPCNLRGCRKRFHSLWGAAPHRSLSHLGISFSSSWGRKRLSWLARNSYRIIFSKLKRRLSLAIVAWPLSGWVLFSGLSSLIPMVWSCSAGHCGGRYFLPGLQEKDFSSGTIIILCCKATCFYGQKIAHNLSNTSTDFDCNIISRVWRRNQILNRDNIVIMSK